ncbi:hypothetical protein BC629DRAFT_1741363 [Irpex lacteus]|nr:hypothetical protein BC629DRAFT_1741363 [Irpex lacteus]
MALTCLQNRAQKLLLQPPKKTAHNPRTIAAPAAMVAPVSGIPLAFSWTRTLLLQVLQFGFVSFVVIRQFRLPSPNL